MNIPGQKLLTDSVAISYPFVHFDTVSIITSGPVQFPDKKKYSLYFFLGKLYFISFNLKSQKRFTQEYVPFCMTQINDNKCILGAYHQNELGGFV